mgnify:CR=1 FL=1
MQIDVFTLLPHAFAWLTEQRPVAAVLGSGLDLRFLNYRDYTPLTGGQVDDEPYGGGAGMVLRVDVADTGPGIPAERRDRLFEKFAQGESGKRKALGLGLGLFISREIIRRHGGTIWVESELGQGSTFSFRLPRAAAPR